MSNTIAVCSGVLIGLGMSAAVCAVLAWVEGMRDIAAVVAGCAGVLAILGVALQFV